MNVTKEMIQSLPTARNRWSVMNLVPGLMLDRVDVGGTDSGQQSNMIAGGADRDDSTWSVDGANITGQGFQIDYFPLSTGTVTLPAVYECTAPGVGNYLCP